MSDLNRPVTRRELRAELQEFRVELHTELSELRGELASKTEELRGELASKAALDATMKSLRDELRTHFDIVAESLRDDIRNMFDWMKANINGGDQGTGTRRTRRVL